MRVPFVQRQAPFAVPPTVDGRACANCAAPLAVGQDWCLECGTAAPGRFGRGPGLRSSLGVVGVTLLLVLGAVAAAYATLSSDSRQATQTTASVPAVVAPPTAAAGVPDTAAAPGTVTPAPAVAPAPATTKVPGAPKIAAATPTPAPSAVAPKTAPAPAAAAKPPAAAAPKAAAKPKAVTPAPAGPAARSAKILLDTDAASSYNPYGLPAASFGDPAKAIDGDPSTSWTYAVDPGTAGKTQVGLAINLKSPQPVRSITLATGSPGMTVEFYGATGAEPVSITDPAWRHLANRRALEATATVALKTAGKSFDYLLVWITHAPPGAATLGISELSVAT